MLSLGKRRQMHHELPHGVAASAMVGAVDVEGDVLTVKVNVHAQLPLRFLPALAPSRPERQAVEAVERRGEGLLDAAGISVIREGQDLIALDLVRCGASPDRSILRDADSCRVGVRAPAHDVN